MNLIECLLIENSCYKSKSTIVPNGVMIHSTGANNPTLRRYVQPVPGQEHYTKLLTLIGKNPNGNSWNRPGLNVCVHAFIGKLADGSISTVQTLPWNMRGWHSGRGKNGSANDTHIGFEICEDGLADKDYFDKVYKEAVELTAKLCRDFNLDPMADGVVICHSEGYKRGIASNHGDVMHWFPKHGKSMDTFRKDVADLLTNEVGDASAWSAEARTWAVKSKLVVGTGDGYEWKKPVTREELVTILHRFNNLK